MTYRDTINQCFDDFDLGDHMARDCPDGEKTKGKGKADLMCSDPCQRLDQTL